MNNRQPYSAKKGAELMQAKRLVLHRYNLTEQEWIDLMLETGCRFAENFCRLYNNKADMINTILKEKPTGEDSNNFFWTWWRMKWMMDDEAFIKSKLYYDPYLAYVELKVAMVGDDLLERQLLQSIYSKSIQ